MGKRFFANAFGNNTGEDLLARYFLRHMASGKLFVWTPSRIYLVICGDIKRGKFKKTHFCNGYAGQFLNLLFVFFQRRRFSGFLNYLPLWNPLPFLLFSRFFLLGPVTGQIYIKSNSYGLVSKFTRSIMFNILFFVSARIIRFRGLEVVSGNFFVNNLFIKYGINSTDFFMTVASFVNEDLKKFPKEKFKDIDIILYCSSHPTKNFAKAKKVVEFLANRSRCVSKVVLYGSNTDDSCLNFLHNVGKIDRDYLLQLFSRSKYYFTLSHESAGLSAIEAEAMGCVIICLPGTGADYYTKNKVYFKDAASLEEWISMRYSVENRILLTDS